MIFDVNGETVDVEPEVTIVAGFTGRNRSLVDEHIAELRNQGVPTPERVPSFYAVAPAMLAQTNSITVVGARTSGEAEIAVIAIAHRRLVTLASDHTDRTAEAVNIELSKRVCPKPIARIAWELGDVADHWDRLELASWIHEGGERILYQSGSAAELLPPNEIDAAIPFTVRPSCYVVLTGTLPAIGAIRPSSHFAARLHDPTTGRSIDLAYDTNTVDGLAAQ